MMINKLAKEDIIAIHDSLSNNTHLLSEMDPVEPRGIRDITMLESALGKQSAGYGDFDLYDTVYSNCAAVSYGIIKNHPFHNGNKRTGFLTIIKHLFLNGLIIRCDVTIDSIYNFLIAVADNKLREHCAQHDRAHFNKIRKKIWSDDDNILYISKWLRKNTINKQKHIKYDMPIADLIRILKNANLETQVVGDHFVVKTRTTLLAQVLDGRRKKRYPMGGNKAIVKRSVIENIRKDFNLTRDNGFDDANFYDPNSFFDNELLVYKRLIYKLSKI